MKNQIKKISANDRLIAEFMGVLWHPAAFHQSAIRTTYQIKSKTYKKCLQWCKEYNKPPALGNFPTYPAPCNRNGLCCWKRRTDI